ncbi:DNA alkylation repair protein [Prevotella melaninogenica]|jgi:hypothetical protein|uniref:DNA alkylation repair protein n=1 Tax=Prevotella melaninogenica TaxID=28132 RepID=UPI001C6101FA|nr:DNA alkylation repair protein [Prevotella melaninogenica]MBW4896943.1 DNA alkylation repair protein [Prevotella melaninogenica]
MDCSELFGRYAAKIEWCKKPMGWTTCYMVDYAMKNPKCLIKHNDPNYIPKRGQNIIKISL